MKRTFRCLPVARWPQLDQERWAVAARDGDLFEELSPAATWRPSTRALVAEAYGCALAWLEDRGELDPSESAAARWSDDRLRRYLKALTEAVAPTTVTMRLLFLERALAVISPTSDRSVWRALLKGRSTESSRKRGRIRDTDILVDLGTALMAQAESSTGTAVRKTAVLFRDGLQIALLASRPLRKTNFTNLAIGRHLVRLETGWWLLLEAEETKTRQPVEVPFPKYLVPALERYLAHYRPILAGSRYRGERLWLTYGFTPQTPHSLQLMIAKRTQTAFGIALSPHLFRDCAATSIAIHDPVHVRIAANILGHRSFATTQKHYNQAGSIQAGRELAAITEHMRDARDRKSPGKIGIEIQNSGVLRRKSVDSFQGGPRSAPALSTPAPPPDAISGSTKQTARRPRHFPQARSGRDRQR